MAHLLFQTAFPGDLFLTIPLAKRIRAWDPGEKLVLACRPGVGDVLKKYGLVDEIMAIDKSTAVARKKSWSALNERSWDVVFCPHESLRSAIWIRRLKAKKRIGFKKWWNGLFFSQRVSKPMHLPDALRQLSLMAGLDAQVADWLSQEQIQDFTNSESLASPLPLFEPPIPEWASMQLATQPKGLTKRIFLAPGSVWNTKRWTAEGFINLAIELSQRGYEIEIVGSAAEATLAEEIVQAVLLKSPSANLVNSAGKTNFIQLIERFTQGLALICNDSGAMHAAAMANLPTVAVFGPTTLSLGFRPWQNRAVVVQSDLPCRPCGKHGGKTCPIKTHDCMKSIGHKDILNALEQLVNVPKKY